MSEHTLESTPGPARDLRKYAWLSIAAAIATIALKFGAWAMTGSVGLLSDAAESVVNLVAAVAALVALTVAARPADDSHHFGHAKAEYFSAAIEGMMIFVAAVVIIWQATLRLLHPQPIENVGVGLGISVLASLLNGAVALVLLRAGRQHRSITLTADGKHLMTDVWTSVGVLVGVGLVAVTGLDWLDPVVAIAVGINIIVAGWRLVQESSTGLMDGTMSAEENGEIAALLEEFECDTVRFHGLRTRVSGHQGFAEVHVLVPGAWTVQQAHDVIETVEARVASQFPDLHLTAHVEPLEDPRSYDDYAAEFPVGSPPRAPLPR